MLTRSSEWIFNPMRYTGYLMFESPIELYINIFMDIWCRTSISCEFFNLIYLLVSNDMNWFSRIFIDKNARNKDVSKLFSLRLGDRRK